jgi:excisionase family DNA binding protein
LTRRRLTVAEAADTLGISQDAVRMGVKRGTLEAERDGRQVVVLLDSDLSGVGSQPDASALISEMRGRIEDLREQLEAERQGHAEARRLLAAALERIPPQIEAPRGEDSSPLEPRESPVTPVERPVGEEVWVDAASSQEGTERPRERSWWRRMFGG